MSKRTASPGLGSVRSGALTAASLLVVTGVSAGIGVVVAHEFGRTAETDGLLAAYSTFIVIAIAAQAIRVALLPQLARARVEGRLAGELAGFGIAMAAIAVPLVVLAAVAAEPLAELLTGAGSGPAHDTAADALRWMVPAGAAQLFAGLAASGLAALDDYGTAALAYAAGSIGGLALILARADADGLLVVAWGMALNGAIVLLVTAAGLAFRARSQQMPRGAVRPSGAPTHVKLGVFAVGAALPLALQSLYLVCLAFAGRLEEGAATSFVYAYLAASALVSITAGSLGLVTAVPLARTGLTGARAAAHVVATSWLSLTIVGAAAGVFAIAGGDVVEAVLGESFGGDAGSELGRLVVAFSPWMIASVGVSVAFPLAFVAGRTRRLPAIAVACLVLQVPLAWIGRETLELDGIALALALSTFLVLTLLLVDLGALGPTAWGLATAAAIIAGITLVSFAPVGLLFGAAVAAVAGTVVYVLLLALARPRGLRASWQYLRSIQ